MLMNKTNILNLKIRQDIYQLILKKPGLNIRDLSEKVNIPRSTLNYHLNYLKRLNLIDEKIDRKNKRYYATGNVCRQDKDILCLLRQEVPFKIMMYLLFPNFCSKAEIAREFKLHPTTVDFHIKKFLDIGLIKPVYAKNGKFTTFQNHKPTVYKKLIGREVVYTWKDSETIGEVFRVLISHRDSLSDPSIIDAYDEYCKEWNKLLGYKKSDQIFSFDSALDNFLDILKEICFFPYQF